MAQNGGFYADGYAHALIGAPSTYIPYGGQIVRLVYGGPGAE